MMKNFISVIRGKALILTICGILLVIGNAFGQGGACPAGSPMAGNNSCYFVAATGSDSNSGTSESSPWLHAPGMPTCSGNCASLKAGNGGIGIILRGGDTWHLGNSGAAPYTGGTWDLYGWFGNSYTADYSSGCQYEGTQTGCLYVGVDKTWYAGSSWARPILTGDNPTLSGTGSFVSSCGYQISNPGGNFGSNGMVNIPAWTIFDNFELTGLCVSAASTTSGNGYLLGGSYGGNSQVALAMITNDYFHGWTSTSTAGTGSNSHPAVILTLGGVQDVFDHIVIDGSDSNPEIVSWAAFSMFRHMRDSIVRYAGQGVGANCHDIHDNIFEHFFYTELDGHYNALECNAEAGSNYGGLNYTNSANVFYNNVIRHFDPSFGSGEVLWFCPNATSDYWFNNLQYDLSGQTWAIAGPNGYSMCTMTGGQFMFNNTLVDAAQPCHGGGSNNSGGAYMTVYNEHLINSPFDNSGCTGYGDSSNISMSDATATSQGYTTGSSGTVQSNTCANDTTTPCAPTSASNTTVGVGHNLINNGTVADAVTTTWCATLATFTSEYTIGTEAANACLYGTTDSCTYNSTTHTMNCPGLAPVQRPTSGNWNAGAYQLGTGGGQPQPPSNVVATAH